jgi:NADH-quinone oxidoreductase subunit L
MGGREQWFQGLGLVAVGSPVALLMLLGLAMLFGLRPGERLVANLTRVTVLAGLLATLGVLALMLASGQRYVPVELGRWVSLRNEEFEFSFNFKFNFDRLSVPFTILSLVLCGTINEFARRYLHREAGFWRFYLLFSFFLAGMVLSALAGTIETLFLGWEFVGLSSAMLIAYFHERTGPVRNGLRVWTVYRLADAAFLMAALAMHHLQGHGDFEHFMGTGPWPEGRSEIGSTAALPVGILLLVAASGKSALVPFSGWLPRAMEGPTPSSAVFYGALSVHLGVYLLLRVSPVLAESWVLRLLVLGVGLATAISATLVARVQSDVKSSLAYASLTQVGVIVVEIGLGLNYLALVHMIGHASLRTLQLLRAPTALRDWQQIENAIGPDVLALREKMNRTALPGWVELAAFRFGLERGHFDTLLDRWVAAPFMAMFRAADRLERAWTDWLDRKPSRESDLVELHPESEGRDG